MAFSGVAFSTALGFSGAKQLWSTTSPLSIQTARVQRTSQSLQFPVPCDCIHGVYAGPASRKRPRHGRPSTLTGPGRNGQGRSASSGENRPQTGLGESERLQKVMSRFGVASRRSAEELIENGRVCVNGKQVRDQGTLVNWRKDRVTVDGRQIKPPDDVVWVAVHKPRGYLSNSNDTTRRSISDLVPKAAQRKMTAVGNLEVDYSGLVIMTNERAQIFELTDPQQRHVKEWIVDCEGIVTKQMVEPLREGVMLEGDGVKTSPASITIIGSGKVELNRKEVKLLTRIEVRLRESRHHLIRRLFESVGVTVVRASRRSIGPVLLGSLKRGDFRYLKSKEVKALKRGVRNK